MLSMVVALPATFLGLLWWTQRRVRRSADGFDPGEGRVRWERDPDAAIDA